MRGEYRIVTMGLMRCLELPPRARRIRFPQGCWWRQYGTTSACAENTHALLRILQLYWNYLRVRGEYIVTERLFHDFLELPPRARRIRR